MTQTRTKGPGAPKAELMAELVGTVLIEILTQGRPLIGPDGKPVLDEQGEQLYRPAGAADIANALRYVKLKPTADPSLSAVAALAKAAAARATAQTWRATMPRKTPTIPIERRLLWSTAELAVMLGVSRGTVIEYEREGYIPKAVRVGRGSVAFRADEIRAWIVARMPPHRRHRPEVGVAAHRPGEAPDVPSRLVRPAT